MERFANKKVSSLNMNMNSLSEFKSSVKGEPYFNRIICHRSFYKKLVAKFVLNNYSSFVNSLLHLVRS